MVYTNGGTIDLQTGSIVVSGSKLTTGGLLQIAFGHDVLSRPRHVQASSTFFGPGLLHANGVTTVPGDLTVTVPLLITAQVAGAGALHLATNTTWRAGGASIISLTGGVEVMAGRTLTFDGNGCCDFPNRYLIDSSLRNHGTVVWTFGTITLRNTSTITNEAGAVWDAQGDHVVTTDGSGAPTFTNLGTLRKSAGTGPLTLSGAVVYVSSGTIDLQTGSIVVNGPQLTTSGPLQVAPGTTFFLDHVTVQASSTFFGTGLLHANGVTTRTRRPDGHGAVAHHGTSHRGGRAASGDRHHVACRRRLGHQPDRRRRGHGRPHVDVGRQRVLRLPESLSDRFVAAQPRHRRVDLRLDHAPQHQHRHQRGRRRLGCPGRPRGHHRRQRRADLHQPRHAAQIRRHRHR